MRGAGAFLFVVIGIVLLWVVLSGKSGNLTNAWNTLTGASGGTPSPAPSAATPDYSGWPAGPSFNGGSMFPTYNGGGFGSSAGDGVPTILPNGGGFGAIATPVASPNQSAYLSAPYVGVNGQIYA